VRPGVRPGGAGGAGGASWVVLVGGVFADAPILWVEVVEAGADVFAIA